MSELFKKATDQKQYDKELDWSMMTNKTSPSRRFHLQYLSKELPNLLGKSVIDIGCGTGYISELLKAKGAEEIYGIEPSKKNNEICKKMYPEIKLYNCGLHELMIDKVFDVAIAIMVFEHLEDLEKAFKKIHQLLVPKGLVCAMVGDFEYLTADRFNYKMKKEPLKNGEVVVAIERSNGIMHDIVRPIENYVKAAEKQGFTFNKSVPMLPTPEYLIEEPKYKKFENKPLFHLLFFTSKA